MAYRTTDEIDFEEQELLDNIQRLFASESKDRDEIYEALDNLITLYPNNQYSLSWVNDRAQPLGTTLNTSNLYQYADKIIYGDYYDNETTGSDAIDKFNIDSMLNTQIHKIGKRKQNNDGSFFPFLNKTRFDLTRYQIYKQSERPVEDEHCLIKSFIESGKFTKLEINLFRSKIVGINIDSKTFKIPTPKALLKSFTDDNDIAIVLTELYERKEDKSTIYKYHRYVNNKSISTKKEFDLLTTDKRIVEIALFQNHYFINDIIEIYITAAKEWFDLPDDKDIRKVRRNGKYWREDTYDFTQRPITVIKALFDENAFEPLKLDDYAKIKQNDKVVVGEPEIAFPPKISEVKNYSKDELKISYNKVEANLSDWRRKFKYISFADFETTTNGEKHEAYAVGWEIYENVLWDKIKSLESQLDKEIEIMKIKISQDETIEDQFKKSETAKRVKQMNLNFSQILDEIELKHETETKQSILKPLSNKINFKFGPNCSKIFLDSLETNTLVYFHNLKYDWQQLFKNMLIKKTIETGGQIYSVTANYNGKEIIYYDSWKMIPEPLSKFKKMFNLDMKKEIYPYNFYNTENLKKPTVSKIEFFEAIKKEFDDRMKWRLNESDYNKALDELKDDFNKLILQSRESKDPSEKFEMKEKIWLAKYCKMYTCQDVRVLREGMFSFRNQCKKGLEMDPFNYLTSASLSDNYLIKEGCYEGVCEIGGSARMFVQRSIIGGVVATKDNKKWSLKGKFQDFDGVSLYPSSMNRISGLPIGNPKVLTDSSKLDSYDHYIVEIKVTKVNEKYGIPLLGYKDKKGKRIWSNEIPPVNLVVDKIYLEDLVKYQGIEFEVIRGLYWDQGLNNKINKSIKTLFEARVLAKKEKNPIEQLYKLIMNSGYGKTCMKEHSYKIVYKYGDDFQKYIKKNYNLIREWVELNDSNKKGYLIKVYNSINDHKNRAHCGGIILSMSKRIMNEVTYAAKLTNSPIYYRDTDSMHLNDDDVQKIADKFKEIYNRELIGAKMGQFHSDFDPTGTWYSEEMVLIAPKVYCDRLVTDSGEKVYHFRCKGVTSDVILKKAIEKYDGDVCKLYNSGREVEFDLNDAGKPKFQYIIGGGIKTNTNFKRKIQF